MKRKNVFTFVVISLLALLIVSPVSAASDVSNSEAPVAQEEAPPVELPVDMVDVALLLALTAFIKTQLELKGRWVMVTAFVVGLALYLDSLYALPAIVEGIISYIKFFVGTMGSVDFSKDLLAGVGKAVIAKK